MPYVRVHRPNRSYPRRWSPEAVARVYCQLVKDGIPEEIIDGYIDDECGSERRKRSSAAAEAVAAAAGESGVEGLDENDIAQLFSRAQAQLQDNNRYLNDQITIIKRQQLLLRILSPVVGVLRRVALTAPAATLIRSLQRSNAATLQRLEPLKAANDEVFDALGRFTTREQILAALRRAA